MVRKPYKPTRMRLRAQSSRRCLFIFDLGIIKKVDEPVGNIERTAAPVEESAIEPVVSHSLLTKRCCGTPSGGGLSLNQISKFMRSHGDVIGDYSPQVSRDIRRLIVALRKR